MKRSDTLTPTFTPAPKQTAKTRKKFPFIGAGRSNTGKRVVVSERHDEALAQIPIGKKRRSAAYLG